MESIAWEPLYRTVTLDVNDPGIVRVKTHNFPGWTARINGNPFEKGSKIPGLTGY